VVHRSQWCRWVLCGVRRGPLHINYLFLMWFVTWWLCQCQRWISVQYIWMKLIKSNSHSCYYMPIYRCQSDMDLIYGNWEWTCTRIPFTTGWNSLTHTYDIWRLRCICESWEEFSGRSLYAQITLIFTRIFTNIHEWDSLWGTAGTPANGDVTCIPTIYNFWTLNLRIYWPFSRGFSIEFIQV